MEKKSALKVLWEKWKAFAQTIGNFNSRLILTLFYFLIVGVVSLLIGRWQNTLKKRMPSDTNWIPVPSRETDLAGLRKQF